MEESKLFDLSDLESLGNHEHLVEIVHLFLDTTPVLIGDLSKAAAVADWQEVYRQAHTLKASMGVVQAEQGIGMLRAIERLAEGRQDPRELNDLLQDICVYYAKMEPLLRTYK